ncbi:MAG: hypothetical protein HY680_10610 [Chloroflexi bacterium]|nr:hypothetical protein [Chloroflexota bacterium]
MEQGEWEEEKSRAPAVLAVLGLVVAVVVGLGAVWSYLGVTNSLSATQLKLQQSNIRSDQLEKEMATLAQQVQTSQAKLSTEALAAAQAFVNDARGSMAKTVGGGTVPGRTATSIVCARNAADTSHCDYIANGENDQTEINLALDSLPPGGGEVHLTEGDFSINGVDGTFGGILIQTSNVVLSGSGMGTKLTLTDGNTDKNVIRIIGNNLENITVRDMQINANRAKQAQTEVNRFETTGIRASSAITLQPVRNIVVENTRIENCRTLCIFLRGKGVFIRNNWIGNANSDTVELLEGPGEIANNHFEITGPAGVVISVDAGNDINLTNNTINVMPGGAVGSAIRTWPGFSGINIQNNVIIAAGPIENVILSASTESLISGNIIRPWTGGAERPKLLITAGRTTLSDNYIAHADVVLNDAEGIGKVVIRDNMFDGVTITNRSGNLLVSRNTGYTTENSGTAMVAGGTTAIQVNHGLVAAPTRVQLTPSNNPTNAIGWYWVSSLTATQFTINLNADPGASGVTFYWRATVGEG